MPFLIIWCYQMSEFPAAISSIDSLSLVVNIACVDSVVLFSEQLDEYQRGLGERLNTYWESWEAWSQLEDGASGVWIPTKLASCAKFPCKMTLFFFFPFTDTLCLSLQDDMVGWHLSSVSFIINHYCKNVNHNSYFLNKICLDHPLLQFSVCGWWVICITVM